MEVRGNANLIRMESSSTGELVSGKLESCTCYDHGARKCRNLDHGRYNKNFWAAQRNLWDEILKIRLQYGLLLRAQDVAGKRSGF